MNNKYTTKLLILIIGVFLSLYVIPAQAISHLWNSPVLVGDLISGLTFFFPLETLRPKGNVVEGISIAMVEGRPAISYGGFFVGYSRANDSQGAYWDKFGHSAVGDVNENGLPVGDPSLKVISGYPAVLYTDLQNIKYVRANTTTGEGHWPITSATRILDSGKYIGGNSLNVVNGNPAASYMNPLKGELRYTRAVDTYGNIWSPPVVVASGLGTYSNSTSLMTTELFGIPAIAYGNSTNGSLDYTISGDLHGITWPNHFEVDKANSQILHITLMMVNGYPAISYYRTAQNQVVYVQASHVLGYEWKTPIVVSQIGGSYPAMAIIDGLPAIAFVSDEREIMYVKALDADGAAWGKPVVVHSKPGLYPHSTELLLVDGQPGIAFLDGLDNKLYFVRARGTVDISVLEGAELIPNGTGIVDFGTTQYGTITQKTLTIKNNGSQALYLNAFELPEGFNLVGALGEEIPPGGSTPLIVQMDTKVISNLGGTFVLGSTDQVNSPYNISLSGKVIDDNPPEVINVLLAESALNTHDALQEISTIMVVFDQDLQDGSSQGGADNPKNYSLTMGEEAVEFSNVSYYPSHHTTFITLEEPLRDAIYVLTVYGSTSIVDLNGNPLDGGAGQGTDFILTFTLDMIEESKSGDTDSSNDLPDTGFPPNILTKLPTQPKQRNHSIFNKLWLDIPKLSLHSAIVGVPEINNVWDVSWLDANIGWLENTAYPTFAGNTVLTAHAFNSFGYPGPFLDINKLVYGDDLIIHANGLRYIYSVRKNLIVFPNDQSVLEHKDYDWLTLITCQGYNMETNEYAFRRVVQAVLVSIEPEY